SNSRPGEGEVARMAIRVERIDRHSRSARTLGVITILEDPVSDRESISVQAAEELGTAPGHSAQTGSAALLLQQELPNPIAAYLNQLHWQPDLSLTGLRHILANRGTAASSGEKQG